MVVTCLLERLPAQVLACLPTQHLQSAQVPPYLKAKKSERLLLLTPPEIPARSGMEQCIDEK